MIIEDPSHTVPSPTRYCTELHRYAKWRKMALLQRPRYRVLPQCHARPSSHPTIPFPHLFSAIPPLSQLSPHQSTPFSYFVLTKTVRMSLNFSLPAFFAPIPLPLSLSPRLDRFLLPFYLSPPHLPPCPPSPLIPFPHFSLS